MTRTGKLMSDDQFNRCYKMILILHSLHPFDFFIAKYNNVPDFPIMLCKVQEDNFISDFLIVYIHM